MDSLKYLVDLIVKKTKLDIPSIYEHDLRTGNIKYQGKHYLAYANGGKQWLWDTFNFDCDVLEISNDVDSSEP